MLDQNARTRLQPEVARPPGRRGDPVVTFADVYDTGGVSLLDADRPPVDTARRERLKPRRHPRPRPRHGAGFTRRVDGARDDDERVAATGTDVETVVMVGDGATVKRAVGNAGVIGEELRRCSSAGPVTWTRTCISRCSPGRAANVGIERRTTKQHPTSSTPVVPEGGCRARVPRAAGAPPLRSGLPSEKTGGRRVLRHGQDRARGSPALPAPGRAVTVSHEHRQARTRSPSGRLGAPSCDRRDRVPDNPHTCIGPNARRDRPDVTSPVTPLSPGSVCRSPLRSSRTAAAAST
jgi:hypothetical protein